MSFNRLLEASPTKVVLNGQFSLCTKVNAGVPQGSFLRPLLFLIYINDLPNGLQSNPKLFADDTSLFSTVQDITTSTVSLNNDLTKISEWTVQWKMILGNKLKSYYLAEKQVPSHTHH